MTNKTASPKKQRNRIAFAGFLVALIGLLLFWIPGAGLGLCFLGAVLSLAGLFRRPYACAFFGVLVSVINIAFMFFFLTEETLSKEWETLVKKDVFKEYVVPVLPKKNVVEAEEVSGTSSPVAVSSGEKGAGSGTVKTVFGEKPSSGADAGTEDDSQDARETDSESLEKPDWDIIPISAFAEIARTKSCWPKRVKLLQPREIVLFDKARREIMGKMEIPAGSWVNVLEVFPDGSLEVLDCTDQSFRILAADTNFAEEYRLRNALSDD